MHGKSHERSSVCVVASLTQLCCGHTALIIAVVRHAANLLRDAIHGPLHQAALPLRYSISK